MSDVLLCNVLSPRAAVLCGHPLDLCRLEKAIMDFTDETGVRIMKAFIRVEGPELSEYYCRGLARQVYNAWVDNNIYYFHHDLGIEVFSPVDGTPLSVQTNLMEALTRMTTYQPHNLMSSVAHVHGHNDNVIDFGSGHLSKRVSFFLRWMNSQCEVICSPTGTVLPKQAPSPKRSSKTSVRASTFAKCAILNDIMGDLEWEGKPLSMGDTTFVELNTTFLDLGLLWSFDAKLSLPLSGHVSPHMSPKSKAAEGSCAHKVMSVQRAGIFVMRAENDTVRIGQIDETFEYLQLCYSSLLTMHAVTFVTELNRRTGMDFPPHALLQCKDVSSLLEYWDTLEFVSKRFTQIPNTEASRLMSRAAAKKNTMLKMVREMFHQSAGVLDVTFSSLSMTIN